MGCSVESSERGHRIIAGTAMGLFNAAAAIASAGGAIVGGAMAYKFGYPSASLLAAAMIAIALVLVLKLRRVSRSKAMAPQISRHSGMLAELAIRCAPKINPSATPGGGNAADASTSPDSTRARSPGSDLALIFPDM